MRTGTIASVSYTPDLLKGTDQAFAQLVYGELQKVSDAIRKLADGHLDPSYAAPIKPREGDCRFADGTSWNPGAGIGWYVYSGGQWNKALGTTYTGKGSISNEGGYMVRLTNKTGAVSVKGEVVTVDPSVNNAVEKIIVDVPNPIGVFYESGIADGSEVWVVVSGIADVYFTGNTTRGHLARGFLTADGAGYVAGQALSESFPTSPFASDKHFYEIGHILESRTGAGLAKCVLHFN